MGNCLLIAIVPILPIVTFAVGWLLGWYGSMIWDWWKWGHG